MTKRRNKRGGKGQARGLAGSRVVAIEDRSAMFTDRMASSSDAVHFVGRELFSVTLSSTVTSILAVDPSLGDRANMLAGIYTKYRFKSVLFRYFASQITGSGQVCMGVLDDGSTAEGDSPSSLTGVYQLRVSSINYDGQTTPTEMLWKPNDQSWRYTFAGMSGSDPRLYFSAILFGVSTVTTAVTVEVMYDLVFKGATDTTTTAFVPIPPVMPSSSDKEEKEDKHSVVRNDTKLVRRIPQPGLTRQIARQ